MSVSLYFVVISILFASHVNESRGICDVGFWGEDCKLKCADGCNFNNGCDEDNGVCSNCIDGFYGPLCDSKCSKNCVQCNKETGLCTSCENSWFGDLCTKPCNSSCLGCRTSKGECNSCKRGYWGTYCENECVSEDECLFKCDTGPNSSTCQYACKCVYCNIKNGVCSGCAIGFWGPGCYRQCPKHCTTCLFRDGRCNSCNPGYRGNKCQYKCSETCMTCSSSGLCLTCKKRYWGSSCEHVCSQCAACHSFYGYCTECRHGYWGQSCTYKCPDDCTCCNINNGACIENGCVPDDASKSAGTGLQSEQVTTLTVAGITMICVGFVMSGVCVTLILVIIRRVKSSQQNGGKGLYEIPTHQTGSQNDLELSQNPDMFAMKLLERPSKR